MASTLDRYPENSLGSLFVDRSCIACDTCVGLAPDHFQLTLNFDHAFVFQQPTTTLEWKKCREALQKCPVQAIGESEIR